MENSETTDKYQQYRKEKPIGDETKRQVFSWLKELQQYRKIQTTDEVPSVEQQENVEVPIKENIQQSPRLFQGKLSKDVPQNGIVSVQNNNGKVALTESDRQNLATLKKM